MKKKYVIIGASAAGIGALNTLRRLQPESEIVCISQEAELPYNKCLLADFIAESKTAEQLQILQPKFQHDPFTRLLLGTQVLAIEPATRCVITPDEKISYDALLLATGSSPRLPACARNSKIAGIFTFHSLHDINAIRAYIEQHSITQLVIVGAGLSGVECADALSKKNLSITLVDMKEQLLPTLIDQQAGQLIAQKLTAHQIEFCHGQSIDQIIEHEGRVTAVALAGGRVLPTQMIIFSIGVQPNTHLARDAGIRLADGLVQTNQFLQTSHENIYGAGDIIAIIDQITGRTLANCTWPEAMMQGMTAAQNMAGIQKPYKGSPVLITSSFFGLSFATTLPTLAPVTSHIQAGQNGYLKLELQGKRLVGFTLLAADASLAPLLRRAVLTQEPIDSFNFKLN